MRALTMLRSHRLDLLGLCLAVGYALPALLYPHGNDQALHWYVGQGILRGELPYVDAISGKPVGIFVVHALASMLFGPGQVAIRLLELPTLACVAWLLSTLQQPAARPAPDGLWGTACVLLFGAYYAFFDYWDTAHPELWEALLCLLAAVVAARDGSALRRPLCCGAACGAAFMVKYPAAVIALPISLLCGLRAMSATTAVRPRARLLLREAGLFLLGASAVFVLCVLPFALTDTLGPMWEVLVTLLRRYAGQAADAELGPSWIRMHHGGALPLCTAALWLVGIGTSLHRRDRAEAVTGAALLLLALSAFASVVLQRRFFPYHYVVTVPFMVACMLWGLRVAGARREGQSRALAPLLSSLALVSVAFFAAPRWCTALEHSYRAHVISARAYLAGELPRKRFLEPFVGYNYLDHYAVHEHIGLQIRRRARPGDGLCVRGFAPAIYQVAGLRCPSRHVMQPFPAGFPRWEIEFFEVVRRLRPRFIVSFSDRSHELRLLGQLGYRTTRMPTLYVLLEHTSRAGGH